MQKLRASVRIPGDALALRQRLEAEFLNRNKSFRIHIALKDFAIPGDLVLEKEILLHARLVRDELNLNNDLQVEFRASTVTNLFPTFRGVLDVYPAEYESESILEVVGSYEPPLGMIGLAIDTTFGYLIAERSIKDFLRDIAGELKETPFETGAPIS